MMYMVIISVLLSVAYTGAVIWKRKKLPESISVLVYALPKRWQWVWIVWMWVVAITTCIPLISVLGDGLDVLGFVTLACLVWCGGMPISNKDVTLPHCVAGIGAGIVSQVCVLLICPWWLMAWMAMAWLACDAYAVDGSGMKRWYDGKGVLLAELICTVAVLGALLNKLI